MRTLFIGLVALAACGASRVHDRELLYHVHVGSDDLEVLGRAAVFTPNVAPFALAARAHVDTRSTAQVTVIPQPGW